MSTLTNVNCIHGKAQHACSVCEHIAFLNRRIARLEEDNANLRAMVHGYKAQNNLQEHNKLGT